MSHCSLYRLTFAAQELSDLFFLSKLEFILVLNWQHCGTTTKMVRSGSGCTLRPGTSSGASAAGQPLLHGIYWDLLRGVRSLQRLGADSHWMSGDDRPLGWITPHAVGRGKHATGCALPQCHGKSFSLLLWFARIFIRDLNLLKCRRPTLGMFFACVMLAFPSTPLFPCWWSKGPIFSCAKSGEKGGPSGVCSGTLVSSFNFYVSSRGIKMLCGSYIFLSHTNQ
jgi:hypothetical protein